LGPGGAVWIRRFFGRVFLHKGKRRFRVVLELKQIALLSIRYIGGREDLLYERAFVWAWIQPFSGMIPVVHTPTIAMVLY